MCLHAYIYICVCVCGLTNDVIKVRAFWHGDGKCWQTTVCMYACLCLGEWLLMRV